MTTITAAERIRRFNVRLAPLFARRPSELERADVLHDHVQHLMRHAALRWRDLPYRRRLIVLGHAVIDFLSDGGIVVGLRLHDGVIRPEGGPMDLQFPCWGWRRLMGSAAHWCARPHDGLFGSGRGYRRVAKRAWRLLRRNPSEHSMERLRINLQRMIDD